MWIVDGPSGPYAIYSLLLERRAGAGFAISALGGVLGTGYRGEHPANIFSDISRIFLESSKETSDSLNFKEIQVTEPMRR